jgi:hypothetical protein
LQNGNSEFWGAKENDAHGSMVARLIRGA